jgi:2,4-dichlorophenol 6-monooxygenase
MGRNHHPTTRPGHRLAHAWIEQSGNRISTLDLVGASARFVLLTGANGAAWTKAASEVGKKLGVPIATAAIGSDYADPTGRWQRVRGIADDGAILVRPDNHVAWRNPGRARDPVGELRGAFASILGRAS